MSVEHGAAGYEIYGHTWRTLCDVAESLDYVMFTLFGQPLEPLGMDGNSRSHILGLVSRSPGGEGIVPGDPARRHVRDAIIQRVVRQLREESTDDHGGRKTVTAFIGRQPCQDSRGGIETVRTIDRLPNIGADARFQGLLVKRARNAILDRLQRDRLSYGE
jgi:hypothetical protein